LLSIDKKGEGGGERGGDQEEADSRGAVPQDAALDHRSDVLHQVDRVLRKARLRLHPEDPLQVPRKVVLRQQHRLRLEPPLRDRFQGLRGGAQNSYEER
jgi:hypothetical protein